MKNNLKKFLILGLLCVGTLLTVGCQKNELEQNDNEQKENVNQSEKINISRGEWIDNTYNNDFINIKYNMPEKWIKYSDEEIANLMNIGAQMLNEDQQKLKELAEQNGLYCMVSNDPETGANIIILLEKPVLKVTTERYLESVKNQLESIDSVNYTVSDVDTAKISDQEFSTMEAKASAGGQTVKQNYYTKEIDGYFASIIITTTKDDDQLQNILACFE